MAKRSRTKKQRSTESHEGVPDRYVIVLDAAGWDALMSAFEEPLDRILG
jgi:hypothetical protein